MKKQDYQSVNKARIYNDKRFPGKGGRVIKHREELVIDQLLRNISVTKLLDLGAGGGRATIAIMKIKDLASADLVDSSRFMLKYARKNVKRKKEVVHFHHEDIFNYKTKKRYDLIVSLHVTKHLEDLNLFFSTANKLLSKDGYLLFDFANKNSAAQLRKSNVYLRSYEEVKTVAKKSDFKVVKHLGIDVFGETVYFVVPDFLVDIVDILDKVITRLVPQVSTKIFVLFRKK